MKRKAIQTSTAKPTATIEDKPRKLNDLIAQLVERLSKVKGMRLTLSDAATRRADTRKKLM